MATEADQKTAAEIKEDWKRSMAATMKEHEAMRKAYDAYHGRTWTREDRAILEDEKRPVLEINEIKRVVNMITGLERNTPVMMRVYPEQSNSAVVSAALDALGNYQWHQLEGADVRAECFLDGVIAGRGHIIFGLRTEKFLPELSMLSADPRMVHFDPDAMGYDPSDDADYMIIERWFSKERLKAMWPDRARELEDMVRSQTADEYGEHLTWPDQFTSRRPGHDYQAGPWQHMDRNGDRLQVLEWYRRKLNTVYRIFDPHSLKVIDFDRPKDQDEALQAIESNAPEFAARLMAFKLQTLKMQRAVLVGGELVTENGDSPYREEMGFPIATFKAHHAGRETTSVVNDLLDPQRQMNVTYSNMLNIMTKVANAGMFLPEQSGVTEEEATEFMGKTGGVLKFRYPFRPELNNPAQAMPAHMFDLEWNRGLMQELSGATQALMGVAPSNIESGVGVDLLQRSGVAVLQMLYSNMIRTEKRAYQKLLHLIQDFMPVPEEVEVLGDRITQRLQQLAPDQAMMQVGDIRFLRTAALGEINSLRTLKYNVRVERGPVTTTQMEYWTQFAIQLAQQLGPEVIPPEAIVEMSNYPFKQEVLQRIEAVREMQEQQAALAAGTQIAAAAAGGE